MMVRFLRLVVSVFFRQISIVGREHIPQDAAVIFAGNHPNSLLDPILIITSCGRKVHFAAASILFKNPLLKMCLSALGCVPVFRRKDHGGKAVSNDATFAALHDVLAAGGAMGIFPEGISHDEAQLAKLKTGAARIALSLLNQHPDAAVYIVPCGLTYVRPKRFRSRALVQFGPPIEVSTKAVDTGEEAERVEARRLTDDLDVQLRALTVNAADWDTVRVLDAVRRLYQPEGIALADRIELSRRFTAVYPHVKDKPAVQQIYQRVHEYQERLDEAGLSDRDLTRRIGPIEGFFRALGNLLRVIFWAPVAAPGLALHLPIGVLSSWGSRHFSPRRDVTATTKVVIGIGLVMLTYGVLVALAWLGGGLRQAALVGALLPVSGYGTLRVLERGASIKRLLAHGWRAITLRREIKILRAQRKGLQDAIDEIVAQHIPEDMERLFPDRRITFTAEELGH